MAQTVYELNPERSFPGMLADTSFVNVKSRASEGAIDFGRGVVAGTNDEKQVKIPASSEDIFRGVAVHSHKGGDNYEAKYEDTDAVSVLTRGTIWVETAVPVNNDQDAYLVAEGANAGKWTNVSTGNIKTGGKFCKTIANAGLTIVEINLPFYSASAGS